MWIKIGNRLINLGDLTSVITEDKQLTVLSKSEGPLTFGTSVDCLYQITQEKLDALKLGLENTINALEIK